jgi:hypothetical protein
MSADHATDGPGSGAALAVSGAEAEATGGTSTVVGGGVLDAPSGAAAGEQPSAVSSDETSNARR